MKRFAVLFCTLLAIGFAGQAFASYQISYLYVQHRVYQDGRDVNRLYFQIQDDAGNFVRQNLLTSISFTKGGVGIGVSEGSFTANDLGMWAGYSAGTGQWNYDGIVHDESGYSFKINAATLAKGNYKLVVTYNGIRLAKTYTFNKLINLPTINSQTIKASKDGKGNLFCNWLVPKGLYYLTDGNAPASLSARALIDIYQGGQYIAYIQTSVPIHMNQVFFPARIVNQIKTFGGDTYRFRIQLRSNDNNNRTYSNYLDLNL